MLEPVPCRLMLVCTCFHIRSHCIACVTSPNTSACAYACTIPSSRRITHTLSIRACMHPFLHSFSLYRVPPPICVTHNTRQCLLTHNNELCLQHLSSSFT